MSWRRTHERACIYPERPPIVVVYETEYRWAGDEGDSWAEGDHDDACRKVFACVPDHWDIEAGETPMDLALNVMNDQPAYLEPDCMPGVPSWFSGSDHENDRAYRTGGWTEYSVHLYGFSEIQRVAIGHTYATR